MRLAATDNKLNAGGIGALDADPVCGCQDFDGIWDLKIEVSQDSPQTARAQVSFYAFKRRSKDDFSKLVITLAPEHGQWRIHNIVNESDPGMIWDMRKALEADIASIRKGSN